MASIRTASALAFKVEVDDVGILFRIPRYRSTQGLRAFFEDVIPRFVFFRVGNSSMVLADLELFNPTLSLIEITGVDDATTYRATIDAVDYDYPAQGGDLLADILAGLRVAIDGVNGLSAQVVNNKLEITKIDLATGELLTFTLATSIVAGAGTIASSNPVEEAAGAFIQRDELEEIGTRGEAFLALRCLTGESATVYFRDTSSQVMNSTGGTPRPLA